MKLKFTTIDDVKKFCSLASRLEGDVFLKTGRYIVDGKSIAGIFSLSLDKPIDLEVVSRDEREVDSFVSKLRELGIYRE